MGRWKLLRFLLVILIGGVLAMGLCLLLLRPYLRRAYLPSNNEAVTEKISTLTERGTMQLRDGNVFQASQAFHSALELSLLHPNLVAPEQRAQLHQLQRQTDLLAHLLDQSLEEIALQAMQHRSDQEWNEKFMHYLGRGVVFDDVLRRDGQGVAVLSTYAVRVSGTDVRIALNDLVLLRQFPLHPPVRCLFGARLASCRREEGGQWVFRFEPGSAVFFTEESAAAFCCPQPLDAELLRVLQRQKEWLQN